ncbi:MAG: hypothetical protein HQ549_00850 [Candidatus Omnitrophica bacterium]|nr:hypothetical protein [Candidatus Omnitrophota bacterium]
MPEEEKSTNIFESIEFIFRHPWLFISPFIIIMSVVFAKISDIPPKYVASATVSFETRSAPMAQSGHQYAVKTFIRKLSMGEGLDRITKEVWPSVSEEKNPDKIHVLREQLQNIRMAYNAKESLMDISFQSEDAELCFKVVLAAINGLRIEMKEITMEKIEVGLKFLKKQEEYYGNKIKGINEGISDIKVDLRKRSKDLTDAERALISEITGERDLAARDQAAIQKMAKYDEMLSELQLELLEAQKNKNALKYSLESGKYLTALPGKNPEEDAYVERYSKQIADKELEVVNLTLQGFMSEHPQIKKIERNIQSLKALRQRRIAAISEGSEERDIQESETAKKEAKNLLGSQIEEVDLKIATLEEKIELVRKKYEKASPQSLGESSVISELASRLQELTEEKKISQGYYQEIRRQIGETELKTRIEELEAGLTLVVVKKPQMPGGPMPFQKAPKVIFGLVISLFIGTGLAYTSESMDNSIKSVSELRELLHAPILGSVDRIATIGEVRLKMFRRNIIIISLIIFALSAKFLLKLKLFQLFFTFLK